MAKTMRPDQDNQIRDYASDRTIDLRDDPHAADHGREADAPQQIPAKGWKDVLLRVKNEAKQDNLTLLAAGIAFFSLLSLFPAIGALISIYGLVASPEDVARHISELSGTVPQEARTLLDEQLRSVASASEAGLGIGAVVGIVLALWSASSAMKHLMVALSSIYDEEEGRGFVKLRLGAYVMTFAAIVFFAIVITALTAGPTWIASLGNDVLSTVVSILRWPVLVVLFMAGLAVLYRYAPDRDEPKWRWVSWGSGIATGLWILSSVLFSLYANMFGSYNKTYGSVAAVVVTMMWLFITAACVLLGAEINAELEHQTMKDSTKGEPRPLGDRGAEMADTVGEAAPAKR
jgi:membrane protein